MNNANFTHQPVCVWYVLSIHSSGLLGWAEAFHIWVKTKLLGSYNVEQKMSYQSNATADYFLGHEVNMTQKLVVFLYRGPAVQPRN